jgi:hypothetical protein
VEIGIDGEALTFDPPLRFVIRPGALVGRATSMAARRLFTTKRCGGAA